MIFLVDNGSVRPEAYKNLCRIAAGVSESIGEKVLPAPLLHADKISPKNLDGATARLVETWIKYEYDKGKRKFEILPLFFGPSSALTDYLPRRLKILSKDRLNYSIRILNPLFKTLEDGGDILTDILQEIVMDLVNKQNLKSCSVVLVDHGSPRKEVTAVRNALAKQLGSRLENSGMRVEAASMERRGGEAYAFNEPLLEAILKQNSYHNRNVVLAQLFISPGRHAGPEGDVAVICADAEKNNYGLKTYRTELIGNHPKLIELLSRRWHERESRPWLRF